jgi:cell division protease FtsH
MILDAWFPIGYSLPDGSRTRSILGSGEEWQIFDCEQGRRALAAEMPLFDRWVAAELVAESCAGLAECAGRMLAVIISQSSHDLYSLKNSRSPSSLTEAMSFASALRETRAIEPQASLENGLYLERLSRILPVYGGTSSADDSTVLGVWLSGGLNLSVFPLERFQRVVSWLGKADLQEIVVAAHLSRAESEESTARQSGATLGGEAVRSSDVSAREISGTFKLAGRRMLEAFFNEHVIELVQNRESYKTMGIDGPGAIILEGPPGCGKTFAVTQLVEFLGWPLFSIEASSVASPYIHETSKKVSEVFFKAMDQAPSVIVIDEMEAFLADRGMGSGSSHHRVEEMAEFLRRIPEAIKKGVLIIGMTNRLDMMDQAILRRGRFDHVVRVEQADEAEVEALLKALLDGLPKSDDIDIPLLATRLTGRPLSDVTYVVREGARLAARERKRSIDNESLVAALASTPPRDPDASTRRIGFL